MGTSTIKGATVIFKCNDGYMLQPKQNYWRQCQADKSWSGSQPKCVRKLKILFPSKRYLKKGNLGA